MLNELGLIYGAFDFVRMPNGKLVFLQINPTDKWAWLEEKLDFPMREAFVEVFFGAAVQIALNGNAVQMLDHSK